MKEMGQLIDSTCVKPICKKDLTEKEITKALESFLFFVDKNKDKTVVNPKAKGRHVADGSTERDCIACEEAASPTTITDAVLMTGAIDAQERRDVGSFDVPNAFIQTVMGRMADRSRKIVRLMDDAVNILCEIDPTFSEYVLYEEFSHCWRKMG